MRHGRRVLVTGGASFIGSHLVDALIARGATVRVIDNLSSGDLESIKDPLDRGHLEFIEGDLREPGVARSALKDIEVIFHLAADHGGRGYVDTHQAGPASNLFLDGTVFWEAVRAGVQKVVFASSGCVYPNHLQTDAGIELYLQEDRVGPPYEADNMYGWAKLMAEMTLRSYCQEFGLKAVSLRYFTVYGPRAKEDHAIMAMIARAYTGQNPFDVWGTGEQIRNWTYIDDIVEGTLRAAERIDDGRAINLGTMERIRVIDAARLICRLMGHHADFTMRQDMPMGPANRVADNRAAANLLDWKPSVAFSDGVKRTVDWYVAHKTREQAQRILKEGGLMKRKISAC